MGFVLVHFLRIQYPYMKKQLNNQQCATGSCGALLLFIGLGCFRCKYGNLSVTSFLFIASTQIIMSAIHGTGTAFTFHIIMSVLRFDFFSADIAADRILNNHFSFLDSSDEHLLRRKIENNIAVYNFRNNGIPGRSNDKYRFLLIYFYRCMI